MEYCGKPETHDYQLYPGINGMEHTRTKARHPQTNGIRERFHKTILHEFYPVAFRAETVSPSGGATDRPGLLDGALQHRKDASRKKLPRRNAHTDAP
jgi:transposase InsO family protein